MADRPPPPRGLPPRPGGAPPEAGFDALLEERFSGGKKREMAREVAEHDRKTGRAPQVAPGVMPVSAPPPPFDREHVRRKIRFQGAVPEPLQKFLRAALPELLAFAAGQGLRLRDLNHEIHIVAKAAHEAETGKPVPATTPLPAASYRHLPVSRIYQVRVVLSDRPPGTAEAVAILRVAVARLLGDIFLREEVYSRAAYEEDRATGGTEVSAALEEMMLLLAESGETTPALAQAIAAHGKQIGMSAARVPEKVRQAFFQDAAKALEKQKLPPEHEAAIRGAYARFLERFRADLAAGLAQTVEAVDKLNRQLNFLPPDETPDYLELKASNPRHYLRAAKLRLEHQLEVLGAALDAGEALEREGALSPLLEEQIEGHLSELRKQNLARPYLVPGATLSDELEAKRAALPFEIHAILKRLPPAENPGQAFQAMQRRLSESLYQRLFVALLGLKTWMRLREQGKGQEFLGGERHRGLKGQLSNFRFRQPLLRGMNARLGIVQDVLDASPEGGASLRFPVEPFARAWSHFVSFRVTGEALAAARGLLPRFEAEAYWRAMDAAVRQAVARGPGYFHVVYLLGRLHERAGDEGLAVLVDLLQQPPGTWRFVIHQALAPPPSGAPGGATSGGDPAGARLAQLDQWAEVVLEARRRSQRHAILPGAPGG